MVKTDKDYIARMLALAVGMRLFLPVDTISYHLSGLLWWFAIVYIVINSFLNLTI